MDKNLTRMDKHKLGRTNGRAALASFRVAQLGLVLNGSAFVEPSPAVPVEYKQRMIRNRNPLAK